MKIYLTILLTFLLVPVAVFAAYNDVTISNATIINVGSIDLVVSGTAQLSSITVSADSFTVDLSQNSSLAVTSANRRNFTVSPSGYTQSQSCDTNSSVVAVSNSTDSTVTFTITPLSTTCTIGITSSSDTTTSSSNSGGGGGSGSAPSVPAQTTTPAVTTQQAVPSASTPKVVGISSVFAKILKPGSVDSDVTRLQQLLNSDPDTAIAKSGIGSLGKETTIFGSLTKEAVKKFQCKYKVACSGNENTTGYGSLGPKTRAKLAEIFGKQSTVQQPSAVSNLQSQIQVLLKQIQELQAKMKAI